ncbi:hypothetical protein RSSM_04589 [Rhodopirellula sallentina SM41]|uniref:Uncharacterized protein n=1 Tax=Rhodopirellula sallentina SM41 TaxID=1263870 RepID=M5TXR9_9BACT|nr:hypothetical protein RSSM_04589 [Rhodopirellula sallentina SM41]
MATNELPNRLKKRPHSDVGVRRGGNAHSRLFVLTLFMPRCFGRLAGGRH